MASCTAAVRRVSDYALAYARSAPGITNPYVGVVPVGVGGYRVLEAQSDGTNQWLKLEFDGGGSGWVRDDVLDIQGDCTLVGYGVLNEPKQASTLVRGGVGDNTPITRPTPTPPVTPPPPPSPADTAERVRKAAFNITAGFEGGRYDSYQNVDAGIVSFGRFQFTLAAGSLFSVLDRYLSRSSGTTADQLRNLYQQRCRDRDPNLRNDNTFRDLLKASAADLIMQTAQEEIATELYWNVIRDLSVIPRNLTLPLSQAFLFDTGINHGTRHDMIGLAEQALGVPPKSRIPDNGITEQALITKVVEIRRDRLYKIADAQGFPGLKPRGDFWVTLVQSGDWTLQGDSSGRVQIRQGQFIQVKNP
jgi:hypothetical protein